MSKLIKLQKEIDELTTRFQHDKFLLSQAFLQLIHRENIIVVNRLREKYGEPPITPEPLMYKGNSQHKVEWVIDVPKEWTSLTGKQV